MSQKESTLLSFDSTQLIEPPRQWLHTLTYLGIGDALFGTDQRLKNLFLWGMSCVQSRALSGSLMKRGDESLMIDDRWHEEQTLFQVIDDRWTLLQTVI